MVALGFAMGMVEESAEPQWATEDNVGHRFTFSAEVQERVILTKQAQFRMHETLQTRLLGGK